jgi:glycosyltransferase involved in cell wall biosynthesis
MTFETVIDYCKPEFKEISSFLEGNNINHIPCRLPKLLIPNGRFWVWLIGIINAVRLFFHDKPDIIHTRSYPPTLIGLVCKFLFGVKVVFDMRGIYVDEIAEAGIIRQDSNVFRFERFLEKQYFKYSDVLISVSENHLNYANRLFRDSFDVSEKNFLIKNCVDLKKFLTSENSLNSFDKIRLIYIGNFTAKYDIKGVLDFFHSIVEKSLSPKLTILTYMDEKPFYDLLQKYPETIRNKVRIDRCNSSKIPEELINADAGLVLLNPYPSNEVSAPIKFIEYMSAGIPVVVSSNVGDCNKIVDAYKAGVTIYNHDYKSAVTELRDLFNNPGLKEDCRRAAEKEFDLDRACSQYYNIYSMLLDDEK